MTGRLCEGRVVLVTGAGRGLGREHALAFAAAGARVLVNDLGAEPDGSGGSSGPAAEVVETIRAAGGQAELDGHDVADWAGAAAMVSTAVETFGGLDVVVNNAGFVRDRMVVGLSEDEWDAVVRVHLKGHAAVLHHAAGHWRAEAKAGRTPEARVINTTSGAGLLGSVGQGAYAAAKAGIVGLTLVAAQELARYGVTVNAIAPAARTRMTEGLFESMQPVETGFDEMDPANVSPLVVWLGSERSGRVTGRVFEVQGGSIGLATGWRHGPTIDQQARWDPADLDEVVASLLADGPEPLPVYGAG